MSGFGLVPLSTKQNMERERKREEEKETVGERANRVTETSHNMSTVG